MDKPKDNFPFADTLELEKNKWLLGLIITKTFYSMLRKIGASFIFFLLKAVF